MPGLVLESDSRIFAANTRQRAMHSNIPVTKDPTPFGRGVTAAPFTSRSGRLPLLGVVALMMLVAPSPAGPAALAADEDAAILQRHGRRDARVHDPSTIVKCGADYWLFATGMGVQSWRSSDLEHWERGPRVFEEPPPWITDIVPTQRGHFWAPDIIHHQGRYLLYYSVSSFGKNTSAIALATNPTLDPASPDYRWTDHGVVVRSRADNDFNAIDPAVFQDADGSLWLAFGSFWSGIKLVGLNPETGLQLEPDQTPLSLAWKKEIEAPALHARDGWHYVFVNWGICCRGTNSTYEIRVGRSRAITGPYLDREGVDLLQGGGSLVLASDGPFVGPGHAGLFEAEGRAWFGCHFYDATDRGRSWLALQPLNWDAEGWPVVGDNPPATAAPAPSEATTTQGLQ